MLCCRPSRSNAVFADFDRDVHVVSFSYDAALPLYRSIDFGFVNPFVRLWLQVDASGNVRVLDEYVRREATIPVHHAAVCARTPCPEERVAATFCDPAGEARSEIDGASCVRELRRLGMPLQHRGSSIAEGLELIRRALRAADHTVSLFIDPRCVRLIEACECYHYPEGASAAEAPLKDGIYDHPIDALRYFFINRARRQPPRERRC